MATVYQVLHDPKFQSLQSVDSDAFLREKKRSWRFDGTSVEDEWVQQEMFVREPLLKKPDIWSFFGSIAFEDNARKVVQMCLDQSGEQLPLTFEGRKLTVLNVTYVIDALDKKKSVSHPELDHIIKKFVFHADRLDFSLFKIPQTRQVHLYTVEGLASPYDEFKPLVEKYKLKGLVFKKLWTSE